MSTIEQLSAEYKGRKWYRQRFDGSPLFLHAIADAETGKDDRLPAGVRALVRICFFSEGIADWYLDMADVERGAAVIVEQAKANPNIGEELIAKWKKDEELFEEFVWKELPAVQLTALTSDDLITVWKRYWAFFQKRINSSPIIDHFALGTDVLISDMLRKEIGETESESEFTEIFSTLTAPVHQSFINEAEIDLLRIATNQYSDSIEDYQQKYFWTRNNYVSAHDFSIEEIKEEIDAWKLSGKDLQQALDELQQTPILNQKKKTELLQSIKLSTHLRTLLSVSESFTRWQDERKKSTYLNIHAGTVLLQEVAQRSGYNIELLKYTNAPEVIQIIDGSGPAATELEQRKRNSVFVWTASSSDVLTGDDVEVFRNTLLGTTDDSDIQDIRGLSASMGKVKGRVKVLGSATEVGKVKEGDILVAVMTRPDYVPAMKKAAAILTDEGGITSHAAIVSRELGIPCIIGTKIATAVFQDGDMVEVNANHGWARKVQK